MISIEMDFDDASIEQMINDDLNAWFEELKNSCRSAAKKFVDGIRAKTPTEGSWNNRTWNLRSSIGFLLVFNGKIVEEYFPALSGGAEGSQIGKAYAEEIALLVNEGEGVQMVIVAGMEYAVFVEGNGIDVLTHASKGFPKVWINEFKDAA